MDYEEERINRVFLVFLLAILAALLAGLMVGATITYYWLK